MTISHNRQNLSTAELVNEVEIYDKNGRFDPVASAAENLEVFSEANIVRLPGGSIDHNAVIPKHATTKSTVFQRRK